MAPLPGEASVRLAVVVVAAVVLLAVGAVHWWRWRLGFDRVQLALVVACLLGAGALVSLQVGTLWRLSWWDYHAFLLTGFAAAIYAVLTGYRRSRTLEGVLDGVFAADPMAHISRGYSETLRALIGAVEARDAYTHGHSARVAELAVHLGQRLGLGPAALRSLAEGAYLHDVGKVGIPDHVLNKPGALSEESGPGSSSTRWSAPTSSGGLRRCAGPSRSSASTMSASTATATPTASPVSRSRWPPGSSPWSTCGTRSPRTAPTGRPGRPTAPCAIWWPAGAPISTPTAWTPSWP